MSKIQKALQQLRESRGQDVGTAGGQPGVNGSPHATEAEAGNARARQRSLDRSRLKTPMRPDAADTATMERLPDTRIHVDVDALREAGLYPTEDYAEEIAQQFRRIKRPVINLAFGDDQVQGGNGNLIMVASALPKSGKTYCSLNLAASIARERDIGAVLVDADVLKPNISRAMGLEDRVGLIDVLLDPSITLDDIVLPSDWHDIVVIPAGQQHEEATELLASRRMEELVSTLSQRFASRAVIVDTPPLLVTNEAHVLSEHMGQIVMVIEAGVSTEEAVQQALESLNRDKPINAILNKARGGLFGTYGYEGYGYYSVPKKGHRDDGKK